MIVDRYSSWPLVYRATDLSAGELVRILRRVFTSYGVPEEFTWDGATVFTGHVFEEFCATWECGIESPPLSGPTPHWVELDYAET